MAFINAARTVSKKRKPTPAKGGLHNFQARTATGQKDNINGKFIQNAPPASTYIHE